MKARFSFPNLHVELGTRKNAYCNSLRKNLLIMVIVELLAPGRHHRKDDMVISVRHETRCAKGGMKPVSYTHLTLPTIYSV